LIYKAVCWCSGARLYLLDKCPSEHNTYFGIGSIVILTGIMAFFSGSYAFFTVFENPYLAASFGFFWGTLIFFLDWYLVSSLRKQNNLKKELAMAAPRFILALFLGIVISKPVEMKLLEKEINQQISSQKVTDAIRGKTDVDKEFGEIGKLKNENEQMALQLKSKEMERNALLSMVISEAEGQSPTGKIGKGPVYAEKKIAYAQSEKELSELNTTLLPLIKKNTERVDELTVLRDKRVGETTVAIDHADGFLARITALDSLAENNVSIRLVNWFIMLLFICIESAPMIVKLLSSRGPYDEFLDAENYEKTLMARRIITELDMHDNKDHTVLYEKNKLEFAKSVEANADFIEKLSKAKSEINEKIVEKWKQNELEEIEKNFKKYIPLIENTFKSKRDEGMASEPLTIQTSDGSVK